MPTDRFFIETESNALFQKGQMVSLFGDEFHHLSKVMRLKIGDEIEVVNGYGVCLKCQISLIAKDHADIQIGEIFQKEKRNRSFILAQALPKPNRLDFILEKGTELGVDAFWFFSANRSLKSELSETQMQRCRSIVISAMKQSGNLYLPKIEFKPHFKNWQVENDSLFFGDLSEEAKKFSLYLNERKTMSPCIFIVGPEGGLDESEIAWLRKINAMGVKLHDNILRTDTAGIVASAIFHEALQ